MAVQSTAYGDEIISQPIDCDVALQEIVNNIHQYLLRFGNSWFFLLLGKSYFQKCCRSWLRVTTHLEKFLTDPRSHYSMLMLVLEHEMAKFPVKSFYGKQLKALELLLVQGPIFSITTL